jgi:hypothetical protein
LSESSDWNMVVDPYPGAIMQRIGLTKVKTEAHVCV